VTADRIQRKVVLHASRKKVWQAIADARQFGSWFGMKFEAAFVPGATVRGVIAATTVDPEIAKSQEPYVGMPFVFVIERMEPEKLFSYRWHPHALEPGADYSKEPTTLVVFELEDAPDGTLLTVTESGFDAIPVARRAAAFEANSGGWSAQMVLIGKYLERAP
jgi:uncharacterized protein YndB with AHSA1/START domain